MSQPHNIRPDEETLEYAVVKTPPSHPEQQPQQDPEDGPTDEHLLATESSMAHLEASHLEWRKTILKARAAGIDTGPNTMQIWQENERLLGVHCEKMCQRITLNQLVAKLEEYPFPPQEFSVQEVSELYWTARAGQLDMFLDDVASKLWEEIEKDAGILEALESESESEDTEANPGAQRDGKAWLETNRSELEDTIAAWHDEVPAVIRERMNFMEIIKFAATDKNETTEMIMKLAEWSIRGQFWISEVGRILFGTLTPADQQHSASQLRDQRDRQLVQLEDMLDGLEQRYHGEKKWEIIDVGFEGVFEAYWGVLERYTRFRDDAEEGRATQAEWDKVVTVGAQADDLVDGVRDFVFRIEWRGRGWEFDPLVSAVREGRIRPG